MGETDTGTVSEAIFITVPLNQMAAPSLAGPAEHGGGFHSRVCGRGTSTYVSILVW